MATALCYNKGCAKDFNPHDNSDEACVFHPGVPVFHDALKGWSCCKRRTTDFSDFLNIPGCTKGKHSNVKPEPVKPEVKSTKNTVKKAEPEKKTVETIHKPVYQPLPRPSRSDELVPLRIKTTASLKQTLERLSLKSEEDVEIEPGRSCKRSGCGQTYIGEASNDEECCHHPGGPIFHEGLKYWSCCQRKTTDFSTFLAQPGCAIGKHEWKSSKPVFTTCRYDWHQTGQVVAISIYAKATNPEKCIFNANQIVLDLEIEFMNGNEFKLNLELFGVVDLSKSFVTISGSKVEISLRKAEPITWKRLDIVREFTENKIENDVEEQEKANEPPPLIREDDDSDLEGIEDTEFD